MKKVVNGFIKTLHCLCLVAVIALGLMTIIGTGGGGGETLTLITYTGLTTQATIDENNAEDLAVGAYEGGHTGGAVGGIGAIQPAESVHVDRPYMLKVSRVLEDSLRQVDFLSRSSGIENCHHTVNDIVFGGCGGIASYTITVDDETGDFNGSLNFLSYCDDGVTITGRVGFTGQVNVNLGHALLRFSFNFYNLTGTSGSDSFTLNGNISCDVTVSPTIITMSMLLHDNSTGKVYWVQNYEMRVTEGANYVDIEVSGRYYDPDYGYVNIDTPDPFCIYNVDDCPSDGVLVVTGDTGTAGGPTIARLTALSSTTYQVEADTNGDGFYDYDSEILNW